ncbi:MAG: ribosome biogenesis GTPase Der [Gammaproteobacteria bacterium]|jgi:GTP-binding protein
MLPVIALVGRPNVGKSTLFNRLTRSRDALVADFPGLTRDRQYGTGKLGSRPYIVVDTGGLELQHEGVEHFMAAQSRQAIQEADAVIMLVDAREGMTPGDQEIATELRAAGKPVWLAVNKTDGTDPDQAAAEFYALGIGQLRAIAAADGRGVSALIEEVLGSLPGAVEEEAAEEADKRGIRLAFVGRPNVGKSTLVNRILGEERVIAFDAPGTTRDSIYIPFERDDQLYTLIDTAGVRRRARVGEALEKFSIIKTLQAIEDAHVVVLVLDAREGISEQDAHLLGLALERGRALVLAINKWDGLDEEQREAVRRDLDLRLSFADFAERFFISALHGSNVGLLYEAIQRAYRSAMGKFSTSRLTQLLEAAVAMHQPPLVRGRRIKLRYAHQGGQCPPRIVIHGNQTDQLPNSYKRYLSNFFRDKLKLVGTPIALDFRTGENPYAGKRNLLTPRQARKKQRLARHVKRRS